MMKNAQILLLRHGETDWNNEQRFQGSRDIPLNENGLRQARETAPRIAAWGPEIIYASPLQRALVTARIAAAGKEELIYVLPDLHEIGFGIWEGVSVPDLKARDSLFARWASAPFRTPIPEGEPEEQFLARASRVLDVVKDCGKKKILIVSHGGTLRALLASALHIPFQSAWSYFSVSNCSLTGLEYTGKKFILSFCNDCLASAAQAADGRGALPLSF